MNYICTGTQHATKICIKRNSCIPEYRHNLRHENGLQPRKYWFTVLITVTIIARRVFLCCFLDENSFKMVAYHRKLYSEEVDQDEVSHYKDILHLHQE